jgi:ferrous-iron efflux pump FieF
LILRRSGRKLSTMILETTQTNTRLNISAGLASVSVAACLVAAKTWAFARTDSLAIAASLIDSIMDLVVSSTGLVGIFYAAKPPDEEHAFGHTSVEDLIALGQSVLVAFSAVTIAWQAIVRLPAPAPLEAETAGLAVMALSIVMTLGLVIWQSRVAGRTGSRIVKADRLHYLSDLLPVAGAMIALYASMSYGLNWLDPVIALVACGFLLFGAWSIGQGAWDALMDCRADRAQIARIEKILTDFPGVIGFHDLKTRTAGSRVFVQVHLEINGDMTLHEAHTVGAKVKRAILADMPEADVLIHKDPV